MARCPGATDASKICDGCWKRRQMSRPIIRVHIREPHVAWLVFIACDEASSPAATPAANCSPTE